MSPIASASAAAPTVNIFTHGHKKGAHAASGTQGAADGPTQGPATTQGLLSSLLQSIEQVIGVSVTASARAEPANPSATGAIAQAQTSAQIYAGGASQKLQTSAVPSSSALGVNVNAKI